MNIDSISKKVPSPDDMLAYMGLRRRDNNVLLQGLGLLAGGMVLGLAAGLLLAPKPGAQLRADLLKQGDKLREQILQQVQAQGRSGTHAPALAAASNNDGPDPTGRNGKTHDGKTG